MPRDLLAIFVFGIWIAIAVAIAVPVVCLTEPRTLFIILLKKVLYLLPFLYVSRNFECAQAVSTVLL